MSVAERRLRCNIALKLIGLDRQDMQVLDFTYVQGMNVLAAPFLYTMSSEVEAFATFSKFIEVNCPLYVQPTLEGVHRGLRVCRSQLVLCSHSVTKAFIIVTGSMPSNRRRRALWLSEKEEPISRTVCLPMCVSTFRSQNTGSYGLFQLS